MKINHKLFISALAIFSVMSCTDLSENPYDQLTKEDLTSDPETLKALVAPAYTNLTEVLYGWQGYFDLQEESADVIVTPPRPNGWVDGGTYRALHMHSWNSLQGQPSGLWNRAYSGIGTINEHLNSLKALENSESLVAELRVLRAFYYYLLMDSFGNIPVTTEAEIGIPGFSPEQLPRAEVFAFIENEIEESLPLLNKSKVYGQMNYWGARMILAKLYLNAEVYIGEAMWEEAIEQVDDVIDNGGFTLNPSYSDNFKSDNMGSTEQIFSVVFDEVRSGWHHFHLKTLHPSSQSTYDLGTQPWGGSCGVPQFINTYDQKDARYRIWIKGPQFSSSGLPVYCAMDPALANEQLNYTNELNGTINDVIRENEGYRVGKYEIKIGTVGPIGNDVPIFRLADAMMIKAECLLRTGDAAGAAEIVTAVRLRNFADADDATVTASELAQGSAYNYGVYDGEMVTEEGGDDITFGRMYDELGWEFAAEFHRRQDMIRFGVFTTKSWFSHVPNGDHRTIFDIPQSALDANPKLSHNPGY